MVVPIESEHFSFYAPGSDSEIVPLQKSRLYTEDWIGLKKLEKSGRLVFIEVEGDHIEYETNWYKTRIVLNDFSYFDLCFV